RILDPGRPATPAPSSHGTPRDETGVPPPRYCGAERRRSAGRRGRGGADGGRLALELRPRPARAGARGPPPRRLAARAVRGAAETLACDRWRLSRRASTASEGSSAMSLADIVKT